MTEETMVCANHPHRETTLRCNRCEKPICSQCAILTPVGYRCKECVKGQQKTFDTTRNYDYPLAFGIALILSGISVAVLSFLGFWGLFLAPVLGGVIGEAIRWAVGRRRSRRLPLVAGIGAGIGVVIYLLFSSLPYLSYAAFGGSFDMMLAGGVLTSLLWPIAYTGLLIASMYYRLRGIRL
jgi:hypothetical protein